MRRPGPWAKSRGAAWPGRDPAQGALGGPRASSGFRSYRPQVSHISPWPRSALPLGRAVSVTDPVRGGSCVGVAVPCPTPVPTTWLVLSSGSDHPRERCEPPRDGATESQRSVRPARPVPARPAPGFCAGSSQQGGPSARVSGPPACPLPHGPGASFLARTGDAPA